MPIVNHRTYGKSAGPTIYYLTGYGTKISHFGAHIRVLVAAGYRVVAFEYDKAILNRGDPTLAVEALSSIVGYVNEDKRNHTVAGVYGISLGSWLGANVLAMSHIRVGVFNTGGCNLANTVWGNAFLAAEKQTFQKHGHTKQSLQKVWGPYEFDRDGRRWQGKRVLIMSSRGDEVLNITEVEHNIHTWQNAGYDIRWVASKRLRHMPAVIRNVFRFKQTLTFFKETTELSTES